MDATTATIVSLILSVQATIEVAARAENARERRRRRRFSVHPLWRTRASQGEFILHREMFYDQEDKFYGYYRMTRQCFVNLLTKIGHRLTKKTTNWKTPISAEERLAICLRYLATGDAMKTISYSFRVGHSTVATIIKTTCRIIVEELMAETMPLPTAEQWTTITQQFWTTTKFPNCLGAIDGKHINIQAPGNSGSLYYNYKHTFSIVLLAVADANCNFIAIEVGAYGKNSDGGIFASSRLGRAIADGSLQTLPDKHLPGTSDSAPCVFIGDEAFPLRRNLLRPYPGCRAQGHEIYTTYNTRLSIARRVVENSFGILTQKFRIFTRRIHAAPDNVDNIVGAACILHNYIRKFEGASQREAEIVNPAWDELSSRGGSSTTEAAAVREKFANYLFNSNV